MSHEDLVDWMLRIGKELGPWDVRTAAKVLRKNHMSEAQVVKVMCVLSLRGI